MSVFPVQEGIAVSDEYSRLSYFVDCAYKRTFDIYTQFLNLKNFILIEFPTTISELILIDKAATSGLT